MVPVYGSISRHLFASRAPPLRTHSLLSTIYFSLPTNTVALAWFVFPWSAEFYTWPAPDIEIFASWVARGGYCSISFCVATGHTAYSRVALTRAIPNVLSMCRAVWEMWFSLFFPAECRCREWINKSINTFYIFNQTLSRLEIANITRTILTVLSTTVAPMYSIMLSSAAS